MIMKNDLIKDARLAELLLYAKQGDQEAMVEILKRFQPLIRFCSRGLQPADRDDLEQELLMHLIMLIRRYRLP
ncbi:MAG: helix-turn-helix domain-containing protein [Bacillota bacterium]